MKRVSLLLAIASLGLAVGHTICQAQEKASYQVIVHEKNPVNSLSKSKTSQLFLKKVTQWENGQKVMPVDQGASSSAREAFSREVLGKKVAAVNSYWQQMIFTGRGVPPPKKGSDAEVVRYVKEHPGAIGYVSADAPTQDVKVVKITD